METPNLLSLVNNLRSIEHVVQVRFHGVLRPRFIDLVGRDGVAIVCLVRNKINANKYIRIVTMLKAETIENTELHDLIINNVQRRVNDYIVRNIKPQRFNNVNR